MLVLTTPNIEGKTIDSYQGIVTGEAILGANFFKDIFASLRDIVGGRSAAYESELRRAKDLAIEEMVEQARGMGANAVIGVDLDYDTVGDSMGAVCLWSVPVARLLLIGIETFVICIVFWKISILSPRFAIRKWIRFGVRPARAFARVRLPRAGCWSVRRARLFH